MSNSIRGSLGVGIESLNTPVAKTRTDDTQLKFDAQSSGFEAHKPPQCGG